MADHGELEYATATGNDLAAHEQTYRNFVTLVKTVLAVVVVIVILMAYFPRLNFRPARHEPRLAGRGRAPNRPRAVSDGGIMKVAVAAEIDAGEPRVAATPETVKKMIGLGAEVAVEPGAGLKSGILDADYAAAGATVTKDAVRRRRHRAQGAAAASVRAFALEEGRHRHRHHGPVRP